MAARLREWGHEDFISYVVWACRAGLERGLLPHTNLGVLSREDLARLREVTASQGLMLESINSDLVVHRARRPSTPLSAWRRSTRRRAADPVHDAGSWSASGRRRRSASPRWRRSPRSTASHGHIQEVILQNFVPHPRYYGPEVAEIADEATRERWTGGGE